MDDVARKQTLACRIIVGVFAARLCLRKMQIVARTAHHDKEWLYTMVIMTEKSPIIQLC